MKIHQQRVPIISPLDRDYHRRSSASHESGASINSFSSFRDETSDIYSTSQAFSSSAKEGYQNSGDESFPHLDKSHLVFTIVGERDL